MEIGKLINGLFIGVSNCLPSIAFLSGRNFSSRFYKVIERSNLVDLIYFHILILVSNGKIESLEYKAMQVVCTYCYYNFLHISIFLAQF